MFIKLQDLNIHYKRVGKGPPVILVHGWGGSLEHLAVVQHHLVANFQVYALDLPGFGLSSKPPTAWGSAEYAELLGEFSSTLKLVDPVLLGHSFGGKISINAVARQLIRARKLILISSAGIILPRSRKLQVKIWGVKLLNLLLRIPGVNTILGAKVAAYKNKIGSVDYRNATGLLRTILVKVAQEDFSAMLPHLNLPVLLLWGENDNNTPLPMGQIMAQLLPQADLKVFSASGHFPFLDNPTEVLAAVEQFLQG